jgi:predicted nucleotidyltransferase
MIEKTSISESDAAALKILLNRLKDRLGDLLLEAVLFGSKARGDDNPESDIDVLIVVGTDSWEIKDQVLGIGADVSLEQDVLFNMFVRPKERWDYMASIRYPLWQSIHQEGLDLLADSES